MVAKLGGFGNCCCEGGGCPCDGLGIPTEVTIDISGSAGTAGCAARVTDNCCTVINDSFTLQLAFEYAQFRMCGWSSGYVTGWGEVQPDPYFSSPPWGAEGGCLGGIHVWLDGHHYTNTMLFAIIFASCPPDSDERFQVAYEYDFGSSGDVTCTSWLSLPLTYSTRSELYLQDTTSHPDTDCTGITSLTVEVSSV